MMVEPGYDIETVTPMSAEKPSLFRNFKHKIQKTVRKLFLCVLVKYRLASLVGITERESRVGKLGWHKNFTVFDRKIIF